MLPIGDVKKPLKAPAALLAALFLALPSSAGGAPLEQPAGAELMRTVESLSGAWTNRGRKWEVEDRIEELGLAPYLRTEWIDWFTFHENLILEVPGSSDEIVYVTAHWDKVDTNPLALASLLLNGALDELVSWSYFTDGALDNGTGVALALALARYFAGRKNHYTYRFVITGAEEMGLRGARAHMAGLDPEEAARISFAVNLDTLARKGTRECVMSDVSDAHLMQRLLYAARDSGTAIGTAKMLAGASSDHAPFSHTDAWYDLGRGLLFNLPGGLLPQRSWFTSAKGTRVVVLGGCELTDWSDYAGGFFFLPVGTIHGPRDDIDKVDAGALSRDYELIRFFLERMDEDPS